MDRDKKDIEYVINRMEEIGKNSMSILEIIFWNQNRKSIYNLQ